MLKIETTGQRIEVSGEEERVETWGSGERYLQARSAKPTAVWHDIPSLPSKGEIGVKVHTTNVRYVGKQRVSLPWFITYEQSVPCRAAGSVQEYSCRRVAVSRCSKLLLATNIPLPQYRQFFRAHVLVDVLCRILGQSRNGLVSVLKQLRKCRQLVYRPTVLEALYFGPWFGFSMPKSGFPQSGICRVWRVLSEDHNRRAMPSHSHH